MSLNKVMLIGNVCNDPEVRYLEQNQPNSAKVATFRLATNERYRDRNGEPKENTEYHNIVCWRNNADVVEKFVKKGTQLYIEGKIRTRSWDGQDGSKHYTTEINVDTLQLLGSRRDNPGAEGAPAPAPAPTHTTRPAAQPYTPAAQPAPQPAQAPAQDGPDDDLPF